MNGPYSSARDISERSHVVGWTGNGGSINEAFLWQDGKLTLLGPVPGGFTSDAYAVTDGSLVVGLGRIPLKGSPVGAPRAFLWQAGEFTMLGTLPDHDWSAAAEIGAQPGQVVGSSWNVDGNPNIRHAFIWQNGRITDLNHLIAADLGLLIKSAPAITSNGSILANASGAEGLVAVVLTPIQAPLGDLDADCQVGILDLLMLLGEWGETDSSADLNNDGIVNVFDLLILLQNWG